MIKVCEICKKEFETIYPNKKYCSKECSRKASREADKLRKRSVRGKVREVRNSEKEEKRLAKSEAWEKEFEEERRIKKIELEKRLKQGDPKAIMEVYNHKTVEYWKAYKQVFIEDKYSEKYTRLINDIDIREEHSPEEIVESIRKRGRIFDQLKTINKPNEEYRIP